MGLRYNVWITNPGTPRIYLGIFLTLEQAISIAEERVDLVNRSEIRIPCAETGKEPDPDRRWPVRKPSK